MVSVIPSASAGGLYATDRGVRPLGRGGAFVAGADDLGAIAYNPAGLADAGTSLLVDFSWLSSSTDYTRRTEVTDAAGARRVVELPQVKGTTPFLPIPTIAGSYNFGAKKELTAALGVFAPYTAITKYPLTLDDGRPAPSRYSLVSLEGSALVVAGGYIAYQPIPAFRVGAGIQALVGSFKSTVVFSASPPNRLISAPEDPQYDALSQLDVGPIVAPSGSFGMIAEPAKILRLGVSGQLPFWISSSAAVNVRLPTAAPFDKARQEGNGADVHFRLPAVIRAGIELRPELSASTRLRVELAYVRELWSMHDAIEIRSKDIRLFDITGFPSPFGVAPITIPRRFQDSNSVRLGAEATLKDVPKGGALDLRGGISYETSGIAPEYVSPLTYDANKVIVSAGLGIHIGEHWRVDGMGAFALPSSVSVDPAEAQIPRVNPVQGNPTATEKINGGKYSSQALVLGVGANYKF